MSYIGQRQGAYLVGFFRLPFPLKCGCRFPVYEVVSACLGSAHLAGRHQPPHVPLVYASQFRRFWNADEVAEINRFGSFCHAGSIADGGHWRRDRL